MITLGFRHNEVIKFYPKFPQFLPKVACNSLRDSTHGHTKYLLVIF